MKLKENNFNMKIEIFQVNQQLYNDSKLKLHNCTINFKTGESLVDYTNNEKSIHFKTRIEQIKLVP